MVMGIGQGTFAPCLMMLETLKEKLESIEGKKLYGYPGDLRRTAAFVRDTEATI